MSSVAAKARWLLVFSSLLGFICVFQNANGQPATPVSIDRSLTSPEIHNVNGADSQDGTSLRLGHPISRPIRGGETHSYTIPIISGQYFRLLVQQRGIILAVALSDNDGKQIVEMDNPSGGHGPIYISFIAAASGDAKLELRSTESWVNPGKYELSIEELREAASADSELVAAERTFAEGRQLANKNTKDSRLAAIKKYEEALAYWRRTGDAHWEALTLFSIGRTYRSLGENRTAAEFFERVMPIQLSEQDWRLTASLLNDRGLALFDLGERQMALESFNKAFKLYHDHQDRRGQASVFNNVGLAYHRMGALREAVENYEKAIPLRQAENDRAGEANVRNNIGGVYDVSGEPLKALKAYRAALKVWQELDSRGQLNNRDQLGAGFNNVAEAQNKLGEWQQAIEGYEQALAIFQATGNSQREAACLANIGQLHLDLGELTLAKDYFTKAQSLLREKVKDADSEGNVVMQIGSANLLQGNLNEALKDFQTAFTLRKNPRGRGYALTNLGAVYALQNNPQKALEVYDQALSLLNSSGDRQGQAITLYKRGEAYRLLHNPAKALEEFNAALLIWRAIANRRGEATTLLGMAQAEKERNNIAEAVKHNEGGLAIIESLRTKVSNNRLRTSYFATQQNHYELNIELNMNLYQQDRSGSWLMAALRSSERSRARNLIDMLTEGQVDIAEGVSKDLLGREREIQQRLNAKFEAQTRLLSSKHTTEQAESLANEIVELISQEREIRGRIRASNSKYADLTQPQPLTLTETQQQLDGDTLLLEYSLGEKRSYVWAVTPTSIHGFELPAREKIEDAANRLRAALTSRNQQLDNETGKQRIDRVTRADAESIEASKELTKLVLEPVASLLGRKRLVIVADGALQLVPFATLPAPASALAETTPKSGTPKSKALTNQSRWLVDDHELVSIPSASVLAVQRRELANRKPAPHAVAVLADPVFDEIDVQRELKLRSAQKAVARRKQPAAVTLGKSPTANTTTSDLSRALRDVGIERIAWLPFSRPEAEAILKLAPRGEGLGAFGFEASRATATSPQLADYRIIHFATHGMVNFEHPELSGIVLSTIDERGQPQDGFLRLHDIYNLNLPAELVVLSACETGIGKQIKGEGLIALTRGFMYAGAPRVVASLWKVNDAATADLMHEFYTQMLIHKRKPAAALREAQLKLSRDKRWGRSPYFWAGFVLQGEWR